MSVVEVTNAPVPAAPRTLDEAGLSVDLVTQLALKTLHLAGTLSGLELAARLGLLFPVVEPSLDELKWQHHVEIVAGAAIGGAAYRYRITDAGRERAAMFFEQNHYVGVAPVRSSSTAGTWRTSGVPRKTTCHQSASVRRFAPWY